MKILVVKNRAMGDSILTLSSLQYLRSVLPEAALTYALPAWVQSLYQNVETPANQLVSLPAKGFRAHREFFQWMKREKFEAVIDLHQRGSSGRFFRLASLLLGYRYFFHNHHQKTGRRVLDQGVIKANIQRDLDAVWSFLTKVMKIKSLSVPRYLDWEPCLKPRPVPQNQVCLGIVATRQVKMWPLKNYAEMVKRIREKDPSCKIIVPLSTSQTDKALQMELHKYLEGIAVDFIYAPLSELPELIGKSRFYLGNDTGLKHVAVAMGVPTYTFFGPEDPTEWHPYNIEKHRYFFIEDMPCRYATAHWCGLESCETHYCLRKITTDLVWQSLQSHF